jgi:hypothetical protein
VGEKSESSELLLCFGQTRVFLKPLVSSLVFCYHGEDGKSL